MWSWLKRLWETRGGCISQNSNRRTSSPLEPAPASNDATAEGNAALADHRTAPEGSAPAEQDAIVAEQVAAAAGPSCVPSTPVQPQVTKIEPEGTEAQPDSASSSVALSELDANVPSIKRYMYSGGKPVGIANTVTKYQEHKPLKPHLTPFEARVEAKMAEEQVVSAAVLATGSNEYSSMVDDSAVKQQLVFEDASRLVEKGNNGVQAAL